ncbi:Predicted metal-dependent hydrolase, TIM-barrel fold [Cupriavidus sp. YR651]|uniref:amidohydrolase family protein n=1 Tax=Cupriavidus sp. YR651 TaxID=1855315 RepID=UPI000884BF36|nr:amidohydrolase family protein [Cupriavidus sp. YR651]SDC89644.1 Predicted metal-dependent hydrolase, TIM-barrel fold [Cupriavidus sp. YR651]
MTQKALPVVDCHFHVFDADVAVASARYRPPYAARLEDWRGFAASIGDAYGVVVQTSFLGTDNSALLAALGSMPERLRGVAVVDPTVADAELATLHAAGVRGIRLNLYGDADWQRIGTAPWRTLFARIGALGWHVELHTGNGEGAAVLATLDTALGQLPVPVVLDHFGRPGAAGIDDAVFDMAGAVQQRRQLWVKISAPYRLPAGLDWRAIAEKWVEVAGQDRLILGSDWPWTNHESSTRADECRALFSWPDAPRADHRATPRGTFADALRWENAAALYGFRIGRR